MICYEAFNIMGIDPKNHYNPARAENDLSDPNDYDYQYCQLGLRMICPTPMIMIRANEDEILFGVPPSPGERARAPSN